MKEAPRGVVPQNKMRDQRGKGDHDWIRKDAIIICAVWGKGRAPQDKETGWASSIAPDTAPEERTPVLIDRLGPGHTHDD